MKCSRCGQETPFPDLPAMERRIAEKLRASRPRTVPTDELIRVLWGDRPPSKPRVQLSRYIHVLKSKGVAVVGRPHTGYWLES